MQNKSRKIVIIGGGIAGLCAAVYAQSCGYQAEVLEMHEIPGGLATSNTNSGMQWDEPYGWAPTNWLAVAGLAAYQFRDDARRIASEFRSAVDRGFAQDGTIREKYNVESANADVHVTAGYKANVIGFGWTNGVYLKLGELISTK